MSREGKIDAVENQFGDRRHLSDDVSFTCCVEIFDVGGKTPPNRHLYDTELFFG